jgi:hypothetical protein
MNKRALCTAVVYAFTIASSAFGRINETPQQCISRYGQPIKILKDEKSILFRRGGLNIAVVFFGGKAAMVLFSKTDLDVLDIPDKMSDNQQSSLMKASGGDLEWVKQKHELRWRTTDGKIHAFYNAGISNSLVIITQAHVDRALAAEKETENKALQGF